jgi:hypothetical protein
LCCVPRLISLLKYSAKSKQSRLVGVQIWPVPMAAAAGESGDDRLYFSGQGRLCGGRPVPLDHPSLSQWIERNPFCTSYVSYMVYILLIDGSYILEASRRSTDCRRRHLFFRQLQQKNSSVQSKATYILEARRR